MGKHWKQQGPSAKFILFAWGYKQIKRRQNKWLWWNWAATTPNLAPSRALRVVEGTAHPYVFILWDSCCDCSAYCGQCGKKKEEEEEIAAQEKERLVLLTYSWTASIAVWERTSSSHSACKNTDFLLYARQLIIIVMVTWAGMWGKIFILTVVVCA